HHLVHFLRQAFELAVWNAEAPVLDVVRSAVWDQVRLFRQCMEVFLELRQRHTLSHRRAVAHHVKIRGGIINDLLAALISDVGIADVPFARYDPIKNLGSRRHLMDVEGNVCTDALEGFSYAITCNTPADRVDFSR